MTPQLSSLLVWLELNRWHVPLREETLLRAGGSLSQGIQEEGERTLPLCVCSVSTVDGSRPQLC